MICQDVLTSDTVVKREIEAASRAWVSICKEMPDGELIIASFYSGVRDGLEARIDEWQKRKTPTSSDVPAVTMQRRTHDDIFDREAYAAGLEKGAQVASAIGYSLR